MAPSVDCSRRLVGSGNTWVVECSHLAHRRTGSGTRTDCAVGFQAVRHLLVADRNHLSGLNNAGSCHGQRHCRQADHPAAVRASGS